MIYRGSAAAMAPFDVLAVIFSDLDLADLYACQLVCKSWRQAARDDLVLRALCWRKGYADGKRDVGFLRLPCRPPSAKWGIADGHCYSRARLQGCDDPTAWEDVFKTQRLLKRIQFPPQQDRINLTPCDFDLHGVFKCYSNHQDELRSHIWKAKIDPIDNVMITTGSRRGMAVLDLESGKELWRDDTVKAFAGLEFGEGWVVNERDNGGSGPLEVRKFERLITGHKNPRRGQLASIGIINCGPNRRAFCLVWPYVAIAYDGYVMLYDVRTMNPVKQISMVHPHGARPGSVRYVSMDKDFIFMLRGYRMHLTSTDGQDDDQELGGLYVYERAGDGRLVFDAGKAVLACHSAWEIRAQDLDRLKFEGQPLSGCPSLGIATTLSPNHHPDKGEYEWTVWCQAVQPDERTGCLVLSGFDRMMIIPNYAKAFRKGVHAKPVQTIGLRGGDDSRGRCTSEISVADGVAAFVSPMHNLPIWIDLQSLIDAPSHGNGSPPRASTLCLGQSALCDHTAIIFQKSSSVHLNSTRLVVVADFLREDATAQPAKYKASFMAVVLDFGAVLRAKLNFPLEPFDEKPSRVTIGFPQRTRADEEERARWRGSREAWPLAKVLLPSTETKWWHPWARRYILGQSSSKRRRTSPSRSEVNTPRKAPRGFHWRGRVLSDLGFGGTPFWDHDFTEEMMEKHFGLHAAGYEYEDWTDSDAEHDCRADEEGDEDEEEAMLEECERLRAEQGGIPVTTKTTMEVKASNEPVEAYTEVPGERIRMS